MNNIVPSFVSLSACRLIPFSNLSLKKAKNNLRHTCKLSKLRLLFFLKAAFKRTDVSFGRPVILGKGKKLMLKGISQILKKGLKRISSWPLYILEQPSTQSVEQTMPHLIIWRDFASMWGCDKDVRAEHFGKNRISIRFAAKENGTAENRLARWGQPQSVRY